MSVSISYCSHLPVTDALLHQLKAEATGLAHHWWCESLNLFEDPSGEGRAYGDTKLFLMGYSTDVDGFVEVSPEDDSAMAWRDASFITEQLESWSRVHGISWRVSCEGNVIGCVSNGHRDQDLLEFLESMREISEFEEPLTPERISRIDAQYASRWD
jgi:hypothetical protein